MTSTATLNRNQNTYTVNAHLSDEVLFVNPSIASDVEEVEMNIAEDGMDFIFDMLSDLSANRGAYAIREAYSNAYDATVVTGDMTRPIEIVLFSEEAEDSLAKGVAEKSGMLGAFSMFASITDHGCGMTCDDVKKYFTQYGGSNKRGGKNTIGSKGLGSKAPLACADLFTVESTKDGFTTTATIERKQGRNCATVRCEETGKDSGTTVTIPLTDMKTFEQMRECVENIIKWNLDATIIFNGNETKPSFTEDTLGSHIFGGRHNNRIDYVYLGSVPVAVDEEGNEVSFRMWQKASSFPTKELGAVDLNLAGVRYELLSSWREEVPTLIVAGEPGFLNFTPSRDEIKDDDAKQDFIDAIGNAIASYDFSPAVSRVLSDMDVYDMRSWLFGRDRDIAFVPNFKEEGAVFVSMKNLHVAYNVPASVFVKDGVDCSVLFGFGESDEEFSSAQVMGIIPGYGRASAFRVAETPRYIGNSDKIVLHPSSKKDAAEVRLESFKLCDLFRTVLKDAADYKVFVITGNGEDGKKRFVNNEKTIRDAYDCPDRVIYILCDEGTVLSDMDKLAIGEKATYVTLDEMLEAARALRRAARESADASKDFSEKMSSRYGRSIHCYKLGGNYPLDGCYRDIEYDYDAFDYDSVESFDQLAEKSIIMLADMNTWHDREEIGAAVAIVNAMKGNGTIDASVENFLVLSKMNASDIRGFIKAGGKFFSDTRKKPSALIEKTIAGDDTGVRSVYRYYCGDNEFQYYEVDPALVMSREAAAALDNADAAYWHVAEDINAATRAKVVMSLMDAERDEWDELEVLVAKVLNERGRRKYGRHVYDTITFKTSPDASRIELCERYDGLKAAISETFSEIPLDNFYRTHYNDDNGTYEIELYKNADVMLAAMVDKMLEEHLV